MHLNTTKIQVSSRMARALRRGTFLKWLFDELSKDDQKKLGQLAGASVPRKSQANAQVLRHHFLAECSKSQRMIELSMQLWFMKNLEYQGELLPATLPSGCRAEMVYCLTCSRAVARPKFSAKLESWILDLLELGEDLDWESVETTKRKAVLEWYTHAKIAVAGAELNSQTKALSNCLGPIRKYFTSDKMENEFSDSLCAALVLERTWEGVHVFQCRIADVSEYLNTALVPLENFSTLDQALTNHLRGEARQFDETGFMEQLQEISIWYENIQTLVKSAGDYEWAGEQDSSIWAKARELIHSVDIPTRDRFLVELVDKLHADPEQATDDDLALLSGVVEYSRKGHETPDDTLRFLESNLVKATLDQLLTRFSEAARRPDRPDDLGDESLEESESPVEQVVTGLVPNDGVEATENSDVADDPDATMVLTQKPGDGRIVSDTEDELGDSAQGIPQADDDTGPAVIDDVFNEDDLDRECARNIVDFVRVRRFLPAILLSENGTFRSPALRWALRAIHHGSGFRTGDIDDFRGLQNLTNRFVSFDSPQDRDAAILAVAGLIRPTLMSSNLYCVGALQEAHKALADEPAVSEFVSELTNFAVRPQRLDGDALVGLDIKNQLADKKSSLDRETERWRVHSPKRKNKYPMATRVWQHLVGDKGELSGLIDRAQAGKISFDEWADEESEWADLRSVRKKIDLVRKNTPGLTRSSQTINYGAEQTMLRQINEACDLAGRWVQWHHETGHAARRGPAADATILEPLIPLAQRVLDDLSPDDDLGSLRTAANGVLIEKCRELVNRFETPEKKSHFSDDIRDPEFFVYVVPEIDPEEPGRDVDGLMRMARRWKAERPTLATVAREQLKLGRIRACRFLAERLEKPDDFPTDEQIQDASRKAQQECRKQILLTGELVQRYEIEGSLSEDDVGTKSRLEGVLDSLEANLDQDDRYDRVIKFCDRIGSELESLRKAKAQQVLDELRELERAVVVGSKALTEQVTRTIEQHVAEGSFAAAEEIMGRIREGDVDPDVVIQKVPFTPSLNDFFDALPGIHKAAQDLARLRNQVASSDWFCKQLGIPEADRGGDRRAQTVRAWQAIQGAPGDMYQKRWLARLFEILRFLGWQVPGDATLSKQRVDGRPFHWAHYRTSASIQCPIPRFGSEACGWLDIAIVWGGPDPEAVAQWLNASETLDATRGVALFLMRPLDTAGRRSLIHAIRRFRHSVLVIDICLLVWLMSIEGQDRAAAMFSATLAGCRDNPYAPDVAGAVPSEMFFGRDADVEYLWRKDGSCIVYGGRQLGKSALLKRVQLRYHKPEHEQFVFYSSIGTNVADIWEQMRFSLVEQKILQRGGLAKNVPADIRAYLDRHPSCRILFLLDECDDFIDYDADSGFAQISALRDLMTDTERRFKVVLTGLHNVQRFQRRPNQPFAHFGLPLCIGPLAPRDALALVNQPISALGYRFEPQSLIDRILAVTNRHPSLLQLVCKHLVDSLGAKTTYNRESTPPFIVTNDDIAKIFMNVRLSSRMRERFDWTLDLDPRYRVIGYTFAELLYGTEAGDSRALTVSEILDWVREYWPAAFGGADEEELQGLLDEMVGLGVIVGGPGVGYRLRNSNVRRLLGTIDQVREELDRFYDRGFEPKAKTNFAHRRLTAGAVPASPMTVDQESYLFARSRGICILSGSLALGIEQVSDSVESMVESLRTHAAIGFHTFDHSGRYDFGEFVQSVYRDDAGSHDGTYVFVPCRNGNTEISVHDVLAAARYIDGRLRSEKRWIRCLIAVDPRFAETWEITGEAADFEKREFVGSRRLTIWNEIGLTQWFNDAGRTPEEYYRPDRMLNATGGWPGLLFPLMRMIESGEGVPQDLSAWVDSSLKDVDLHAYLGVARGTVEDRVVGLFADMQGAMSVADACELLDTPDAADVELAIRRLRRMAVLRQTASGGYVLDKILGLRLGRRVLKE